MDVIYWLIPLSIVLLMIAVAIFFWAVRTGQFQDLDSAAIDILFDDDSPESNKQKQQESPKRQIKKITQSKAHHSMHSQSESHLDSNSESMVDNSVENNPTNIQKHNSSAQ
ncbi:cbb3-type cytochrome oxidase assembly protein CcoS [Aliikangiella maris]|uniref:Cbb3-type cytochrome oxidase assembly protein CcoS n=2 Tax=Aliikangiella maris TaxID=3162458 RepID=A0ABV2BPL1_9GAMM